MLKQMKQKVGRQGAKKIQKRKKSQMHLTNKIDKFHLSKIVYYNQEENNYNYVLLMTLKITKLKKSAK